MTKQGALALAKRQLALDHCCEPEDFVPGRVVFTEYSPREGRRTFDEGEQPLRLCVFGGAAVFSAAAELLPELRERFEHAEPEWVMDAYNLAAIGEILRAHGGKLRKCHIFFLPDEKRLNQPEPVDMRWFERDELAQFEHTRWNNEALGFDDRAPDMLAAAVMRNGEVAGMAGVSADSAGLWQIGIEVVEGYRGQGLAAGLTCAMAREVLRRGRLPFYGTAMSHLASQSVALGAGFFPAWAELNTRYAARPV